MSLGKGAVISFSKKQKLNVKSSIEGEHVGADDGIPKLLWTKDVIESQGYDVETNLLYQDNKSTIMLAENGRGSSSKQTLQNKRLQWGFIMHYYASPLQIYTISLSLVT